MIQTLADALSERGYDKLTAVQTAVTDPELQDSDLLVSAQTGSGKTVGFGLAIATTLMGEAEHLGPAAAPLALIVAPTRELAFQVMRELSWLYAKAGARVTTCIGGMDMRDERRALDRGAHIVVGTPGRLRDHIQRGSLDMGQLRAVVLDEADEMLDLGFREDMEFMLNEAPDERRVLMFSATVPPMIAKLAKTYQRDAVRVTTLSDTSQNAAIRYQAMRVAQRDSENAIINVLRYHDAPNAIVFANTRAMVNRLTARLSNRGFSVVALSGELSQNERTHALQSMRDGRARVCVATDVAARGIDLPNLDLVIHAELPSNGEGLLHRSGRTGRAGRNGISALILPPKVTKKAERLFKFAKIEAEWVKAPSVEDIQRKDRERLLADPVWNTETTAEQNEFAAELLALHSPERIAAAYLALYTAQQSAPEELATPDAPVERKPFGPSVWFSLTVGRDAQAEPRWLLPLLCRTGNIDKDMIGAIRVQQTESFVELTKASVKGFLEALGPKLELEDGITIRQLDAAPDLGGSQSNRSSSPRKPKGDRPTRDRAPQHDRPRSKPQNRGPKKPSKMEAAVSDGSVKPYSSTKGRPESAGPRPKTKRAEPASSGKRPNYKATEKPTESRNEKPFRKPRHKTSDKREKRAGNVNERSHAPKAKANPPSGDASNTSKRFTPPGKSGKPHKRKPGMGKNRPEGKNNSGGHDAPRRNKR